MDSSNEHQESMCLFFPHSILECNPHILHGRPLTFRKLIWSVRARFSRSVFLLFSSAISCSSSVMRPWAQLSVCLCFSSMAKTSSACIFWKERTRSENTRTLSSISLWALAWNG